MFLTKQFFIYLLRWILSAFVMMIPLWALQPRISNDYVKLILAQIFGAFMFFKIDEVIFSPQRNK
jgi:hypothetical protein